MLSRGTPKRSNDVPKWHLYGKLSYYQYLFCKFLRISIDCSNFAHEIENIVQKAFIHFLIICFALLHATAAKAQEAATPADSTIDEDFVIASVVVASPGTILYSALGHACLRLQCPPHDLDYIFSAEAEDAAHNVARFFAGRLSMGVRAVTTEEYLQQYREEGRAVREYRLNLPIAVKQRLWQQMDERLKFSPEPYDYMNGGCAVSVMHWLEDAIDSDSIAFGPWPEKFERSRKEIGGDSIASPWVHFLLFTIGEGEAYDTDVREPDKCIVPTELVEVLQQATAYGRPLLEKQPTVLLQQTQPLSYSWFTPLVFAIIVLLLAVCTLILSLRTSEASKMPIQRVLSAFLWTLYTLAGAFMAYMWLLSDLPCTQWSVLVVPFNVLPLLLWRWRKFWALPFAVIIVVWCVAVVLWPHTLVEPAHIVLALAAAVMCAKFAKSTNTIINS